MEIIRHKTQKIIVMAMLAIMIMCIATPVFAAGKLTLKSNMTVTKLNVEQKLTATSNTTGNAVYWGTDNNKDGTITIINGGTDKLGRTFVRFKANKEGSADLVAKDAPTNGKELARCKVTVKLSDSEKKDDVNLNLDFEMPDLNIDTSGLADAAGTIGKGLISGIEKIGESGIIENIFKAIADLFARLLEMLRGIEIPKLNTDTRTDEIAETEENKKDDKEEDEDTNTQEDVTTQGNTSNKKYTEGSYNGERYKEFKENRTSWEYEAKYVYNALIAAGATKEGAAGAVGNITQECRWDIHRVNSSNHKGMVQWSNSDRFPAMKKFLGKENAKITDISLEEQTRFMIYELQTSYKSTWNTLTTTNGVITASDKFQNSYEVCGDATSNRREFAIDWYNYFEGYTTY